MWLTIWTGGDSVLERPLCLLVHYLLWVDVLCLIAAQGLALLLLGPHATVSPTWFIATLVLMLAHTAFGFLFAWIDREPMGGEIATDAISLDGSSGNGAGGDGSSFD